MLLLLWGVTGGAQTAPPVALRNPSFEDLPGQARAPHGWYYCNFPGETPPDIHPAGIFGVEKAPHDGRTYVGLVTRESGTFESIGQKLPVPLQAGQRYRLQLRLARNPHYYTIRRATLEDADYNEPIVLQVYGGHEACDFAELLAVTMPIADSAWQLVTLELHPASAITNLALRAHYADSLAVGGHLLVDDLSPLLPIDSTGTAALVPTLAIPDPNDFKSWVMSDLGPRMNALVRSAQPPLEVFQAPEGKIMQGSPVLYQLVQVLERLPDQRIEIGIRLRDRVAYDQIRYSLRLHYLDLGLRPPHNVRYRRLRKTPQPEEWTYADPGQLLWIRIEE